MLVQVALHMMVPAVLHTKDRAGPATLVQVDRKTQALAVENMMAQVDRLTTGLVVRHTKAPVDHVTMVQAALRIKAQAGHVIQAQVALGGIAPRYVKSSISQVKMLSQ